MNEQANQKQDQSQEVKPGDLKASDFFPPGVGWNQKGGEDEEELRRRERERSTERH